LKKGNGRIIARTVKISDSRLEVRVLEGGTERVLFFASDQKLWPQKPMNDDHIAVCLSLYCANKKKDLFVEGTLTGSVLRNLDEFIKIWSIWRPDLYAQIRIEATRITGDTPGREKPTVLAYSGGIDAGFALAVHKSKLFYGSSRDIRLGVLMIGFDIQEYETSTLRLAHEGAKRVLDHFNTSCALLSTNWREDFCPDYKTAYPTGFAGSLHTLVNGYASGMIANSNSSVQDLRMSPHACHLSVHHLLGSHTFFIDTPGSAHTRLERLGVIAEYPVIINNLRVCWEALESGINCGVCHKCVRTRLEMEVYGLNPDIFNSPMKAEHIEQLEFHDYLTLCFLEEIYHALHKKHPLFETIEKVFERERKNLEVTGDGLMSELDQKNGEIRAIKNEIAILKNTKAYRLAAPLRLFKKN